MMNFFQKNKKEPQDLKEILSRFKALEKKFEVVSGELDNLKKTQKLAIQKMGIVRFNPFDNIGGDQSFVVALLDANNSGVVITSLYVRDGNRVYGKSVQNGNSDHSLSSEEKQAIARAISPANTKS